MNNRWLAQAGFATAALVAAACGTSSSGSSSAANSSPAAKSSPAASRAMLTSATGTASASGWRVVPSPSPAGSATLYSVSATSSDNAWAVGTIDGGSHALQSPLAEHWNGQAWSVVPVPDGTYKTENRLADVSAFSADDAWAVGESLGSPSKPLQPEAPLVEHWDGRSRTTVATPPPPRGSTAYGFGAVVDLGPGNAWAVGSYFTPAAAPYSHTLIAHFNGTAWRIVPSPDPGARTNALSHVAASGPDDIWATGTDSPGLGVDLTLAEHWNGQQWRVVPTPDDPTAQFNILESLAVRSPTDAWAGVFTTGNANGDFLVRWTGKRGRR